MSRKSLLLALGTLLVLAGGSAATLFLLIRHEPDAYRRASIPPGPLRTQRSKEFYDGFFQLLEAMKPESPQEWYVKLTDEQINSYFAEDFVKSGLDERLLPEG